MERYSCVCTLHQVLLGWALQITATLRPDPSLRTPRSHSSSLGNIISTSARTLIRFPSQFPPADALSAKCDAVPVDYFPPRLQRLCQEAARGHGRWWGLVAGERVQGEVRVSVPQPAQRGRTDHISPGKDPYWHRCATSEVIQTFSLVGNWGNFSQLLKYNKGQQVFKSKLYVCNLKGP